MVARAIRSVLAQTVPPRQIVVIDDASDFPLELPGDLADGRVRVIRNERSSGAAAARNIGLREAATEIVAFLDDDDEWLPEKMAVQLAWLAANADASLVSCGHIRYEAGSRYSEVFTEDFVHRYHQYDNYFGSFSYLVVRRSGVLLDPTLPAMQDWDFALRVTRAEAFGVIEQPLVKYYAHDLPRITTRAGNHLRGLRRCYLKHRFYFSADARRWLLGRVVFERSRLIASRRKRCARIAFSISLAARCRVPLKMKLRVIARRAAHLGASPRTIVNIRSAAISTWQRISHLLSFGIPRRDLHPVAKS
jgi:glycosyltransferase involved in cell wall biosynthesis